MPAVHVRCYGIRRLNPITDFAFNALVRLRTPILNKIDYLINLLLNPVTILPPIALVDIFDTFAIGDIFVEGPEYRHEDSKKKDHRC